MSILLTILILGIIVFVHELGHFTMAKFYKMPVTEFAIGMGPKLISKKINETVYSIRILPFGGFVNIEMEGENGFSKKKLLPRFIVLIAGVMMNFLTAVVGIYILISIVNFNVSPTFVQKINMTFTLFLKYFSTIFDGVKILIMGQVDPKDITGPVGLPVIVRDVYRSSGNLGLINIFIILSINIGIMNLLPIPALDGGRILFLIPELFRIKINKKFEEKIHIIGIILLLSLMLYVVFNDISKYY